MSEVYYNLPAWEKPLVGQFKSFSPSRGIYRLYRLDKKYSVSRSADSWLSDGCMSDWSPKTNIDPTNN